MSTPLYDSLLEYAQQVGLRLHMPGHAGGPGAHVPFLQAVAALDVTEVPGIDDLHAPQGALEASQQMAARIYGARSSHYLVNGASSGIHALLMALCREGERVLIPRNAHRSFWGGLVMSGAIPVYLPVRCEPWTGEAVSVDPADITEALDKNPGGCRALFLASPSFLGAVQDWPAVITAIEAAGATIEAAGAPFEAGEAAEAGENSGAAPASRGTESPERQAVRPFLPLCVDEAHGGHFAFHSAWPATALQCGACAAVNGLHKNLAVLNQGAILHLGRNFPARQRVQQALNLLLTTSPSFPILASMELALDIMQREGAALLERALDCREAFRKQVDRLPGLRCLEKELRAVPGVGAVDPLKVVVGCAGSGFSGYQLDAWLRREYGIQVEMAGPAYILAMFSPWHQPQHWAELGRALADMAGHGRAPDPGVAPVAMNGHGKITAGVCPQLEMPPAPRAAFSPRQAFNSAWKRMSLDAAAGCIAAEMIAAYPPGIPCIVPGEILTPEILDYLDYLKAMKAGGLRIQGPRDLELESILVLA